MTIQTKKVYCTRKKNKLGAVIAHT